MLDRRAAGADPRILSQRLRELAAELVYEGGKTIFDDCGARGAAALSACGGPISAPSIGPASCVRFDLWEPRASVPVGHGQGRRGWVVTAEVCWSRRAGRVADLLQAVGRHRLGHTPLPGPAGAVPEKLVWDREGAIHARGGRPTTEFAAFCGTLGAGWMHPRSRDAEAKGVLERSHRCLRTNFEPGRRFANELDFQDQLDRWADNANGTTHRTTRAVPAERLAQERERMRPLPAWLPDVDRRLAVRVAQQPYLRFDRNDYSRPAARRVDVRIDQRQITAVALDTGELAVRHRRSFASGLPFTDPAQQRELDRLRGDRRRARQPEAELRPLARYDQLIPA